MGIPGTLPLEICLVKNLTSLLSRESATVLVLVVQVVLVVLRTTSTPLETIYVLESATSARTATNYLDEQNRYGLRELLLVVA
jgi:hypothetical protein